MFWILSACISLLIFYIWITRKSKTLYWSKRKIPFYQAQKSTLKIQPSHTRDLVLFNEIRAAGYQRYIGLLEYGVPILYVMNPQLAKNILVTDFDSFVDRRNFTPADNIFAKMLINVKGQFWRELRATVTPAFTTGRIKRMQPVFTSLSTKLTDFLKQKLENGQCDVNLQDVLARYARDVILCTSFGVEVQSFSNEESEISKHINTIQNPLYGLQGFKFVAVALFPKFAKLIGIPLPSEEAINFFENLINTKIKIREANSERKEDVLQLLMDCVDVPDKHENRSTPKLQLNKGLIFAQCLNFFLGGFESVETTLCLIVYELMVNPTIQDKVYAEVREAVQGANGELTYDAIMGLQYLDMVVSETLRKWPSGGRLERLTTKKYQIPDSDSILDKGTKIIVPIYAIHHNEENYLFSEKFDPERFSPNNKQEVDKSIFLPFGVGPRSCIATRFVYAEMKTVIAHLILNFEVEATTQTKIPLRFKPMALMKPANGIWARLVPRVQE